MDLYLMVDGETARPAGAITAETASDRAREASLRWFDELRNPLRRYLVCAGASPADADEAVQESFLRLYRHLEKSREVENVRAWVFQVARNYIKDERKSAHYRRNISLDSAMEREGRFADPGAGPEHNAMHEERMRRLHGAIDKLPQPQRECILLRSSGLRYREIAEVMGININSVGGLVMRAVARLSEDLA
jgi:RNA polymerase sigma-70 factor (ECF subfamily)